MVELHCISTFLVTLTISSSILIVAGCGYGAPQVHRVCRSLTPVHGVASQNSPSPYTLTLDKTKVKPGEDVTLTISGGPPFKGFLVQGRMLLRYSGAVNPFPMGTFSTNGGENWKGLKCGGMPPASSNINTATHNNPGVKEAISLVWTAPDAVGNYSLWVTVAKEADTFWVAQPSPLVEVVYCTKPQ